MRPNLEGNAVEIIHMFTERNIYRTANEVIEAALQLLIEKQMEEESKIQAEESETPDWLIRAQVG